MRRVCVVSSLSGCSSFTSLFAVSGALLSALTVYSAKLMQNTQMHRVPFDLLHICSRRSWTSLSRPQLRRFVCEKQYLKKLCSNVYESFPRSGPRTNETVVFIVWVKGISI